MGEAKHETRAVFTKALGLNSPEERARYLDQVCEGKPALRQRVEALLQADGKVGEFLTQDALGGPLDCDAPPISEGPGTAIGHYKLLEQIGEGGFGVVFMAEQLEPIRRKVALKVVKPGMDTKQVIARFEAERQALALMNHANIAQVFDAGATDTGRSYFVMELVQGVPLTRFCDANLLNPRERLELFLKVCEAVQHAHQKGIIHRDLKPSNILVTLHDGKPVPKVIDFGTAKALQHPLTEKTLFTAYGKLIGTPQYMSPEQAEMSGLDVDTRADIYSLGVLLYELLTGTTPFELERLRSAAFEEMMRMIRQEEPPKPSTRVSTLGERATEIANHRQVDPALLRRTLQGDLDWIVMKALEKDRARRYETANSLLEDIQRHLSHEPVKAGPPGAAYRARKFIRRHRLGAAAGLAVTVVLVAGAVVSTWQAVRASRAEREQIRLRQATEAQAYASDMTLAAHSANSGGSLGGVQDMLCRWQHSQPDRRGWEWYYLNGLCHREFLTIHADTNEIVSVAWSPDGQRLASAGWDGIVPIWDASTGRRITQLRGHGDRVHHVAWSPDGRRLATASKDHTVRVWVPEDSSAMLTLTGHTGEVNCVTWSRDGKKLASVSDDQTVRIWDAATGAELRSLTITMQEPLSEVRWNPDGTRLAVCFFSGTIVLDTITGKELLTLPDDGWTVSWSPDGKRLATGGIPGAKIRDAVRNADAITVGAHREAVTCVAWSPDGTRLASTSRSEGMVSVADAQTGAAVQTFRGHAGTVCSVSWRPDGTQIASAGTDGTVKVWDVNRADPCLTIRTQAEQVLTLAWHPDGRQLASGGSEGSVRIWDTASAGEPIVLHGHSSFVWQVAWNPAGTRLASGGGGGLIQVWQPTDGGSRWNGRVYTGGEAHPLDPRSLTWSPDGKRLASTADDDYLRIWDTTVGTLLLASHCQGGPVAWSRDGRQLAVGMGSEETCEIRVLDASSGKLQKTLRGHREGMRSLAWSPDSKQLASASNDTTAKIWDVQSGQELHTLVGHSDSVYSVAWSPNGRRLASGSWDRTVRVWDPASGQQVCSLAGSDSPVFALAWSPDGTRIASGELSGAILIHDATPGRVVEQRQKEVESEDAAKGKRLTVLPR